MIETNKTLEDIKAFVELSRTSEDIKAFIKLNKDKPSENVIDGIQYLLLAKTHVFFSYQDCEELYNSFK